MSIKKEYEITIDDGPESGQCSEDEIENFTMQRKSKKHKKRTKGNKSKKRKFSESTSSSAKTDIDFFNPYSVNTDKFIIKSELLESYSNPELQNDNCNKNPDLQIDIIHETFNNLGRDDNCQLMDKNNVVMIDYEPSNVIVNEVNISKNIVNNRKSLYMLDITGIESTDADLRYYLLDFGFTNNLASDVFNVIYNSSTPEREQLSNHENDEIDDNEDEMFDDLPIIDTSSAAHDAVYANSYSPEPVNNVVECYNDQGIPVSYAPKFDNPSYTSNLKPLNDIFDLQTIPEVGPRDPRVNQNRQMPSKFNNIVKFSVPDNNLEKLLPKPIENNLQITKDWEVTVANMVKTHLRLYLIHNDINKEEYKSILKRAVNKIISSGEKKLETDKISKFLHSYVIMMQKSRFADSI